MIVVIMHMTVHNLDGTVYGINRLKSEQQLLPVYPQEFSCSSNSETLFSCIIPTSINVAPETEVGIDCTPPPVTVVQRKLLNMIILFVVYC